MRVQQKFSSHGKSSDSSNRRKTKRVFQVLLVSISENYHFWLANRYFRAWVRTLSYYENGTQKYSINQLENPKTKLFLLIARQKQIWRPKIWNKIDRETVSAFI